LSETLLVFRVKYLFVSLKDKFDIDSAALIVRSLSNVKLHIVSEIKNPFEVHITQGNGCLRCSSQKPFYARLSPSALLLTTLKQLDWDDGEGFRVNMSGGIVNTDARAISSEPILAFSLLAMQSWRQDQMFKEWIIVATRRDSLHITDLKLNGVGEVHVQRDIWATKARESCPYKCFEGPYNCDRVVFDGMLEHQA
jgi:hypothetical protein